VLNGADSIEKALRLCGEATPEILLVRIHPVGWSLVRRADLKKWQQGSASQSLQSMLSEDPVPSLHPDLPLDTALRYVDRFPLVPVVNRAKLDALEGVISERDVLDRYREFGE